MQAWCCCRSPKRRDRSPWIELAIDNRRWQGVPFYLRSGKALSRRVSEIVIEFRRPPHVLFDLPPAAQLTPNILSIGIQPDEGIHLRFESKVPDSVQTTRSVEMDFHFRADPASDPLPDAYERLILDALTGDASLFIRNDEIEATWAAPTAPTLVSYAPGSWGPPAADALLSRSGRQWRLESQPHQEDHHP